MYYYRIGYYHKNNEGIYEHLPVMGEVTTDKECFPEVRTIWW